VRLDPPEVQVAELTPNTFEPLIGLAFGSGPAAEANELIEKTRQLVTSERGPTINYEVNLARRDWSYIREIVAPRLALYLKHKRYSVKQCQPVFLSLFIDEMLYFVHAADFFECLRSREGLSEESFAALICTWQETGKSSAGALPPADSEDKER
jgi:hypothetical protein